MAAAGTVAVIAVSEVTVNTAAALLNLTAEAPVKPEPVIATEVPTLPWVGVNPLITGAAATFSCAVVVATPSVVVAVTVHEPAPSIENVVTPVSSPMSFPCLSNPSALNVWLPPGMIVAGDGDTTMDASGSVSGGPQIPG